jgi:NADPH2:quinone reductase
LKVWYGEVIMRMLQSQAPGPPETLVLADVPDPVAGPGQVVVKVAACGVNFPDALIIEDKYQYRPERPFAPGAEGAGTIEAVGEGVENVRPGDRVIIHSSHGCMAEKLAIGSNRVIRMPDEMPFDDGAALIMTYGTSIHGLKDRARLVPGEKVLILGAAGGVGLAAVELAKAMGGEVIAAVSSAEKAEAARAAGADSAMVYPRGPFDKDGQKALSNMFKEACGEGGPNVIYDPVGGEYCEAALRSIAWEGRHLIVGFPAGIPRLPLNLVLLKNCQVVGVAWGAAAARDPKGHAENVRLLMEYYRQGKIKPHISRRYQLDQGREAITHLASREAVGKVVIMIDGDAR